MAKVDYSLAAFLVTTSTATTAYHDLGPYITEMNGLDIEAITEESHTMGDAWVENAYTGLRKVNEITISGFYDDVAASGPVAILGNASDVGAERSIKVKFGTTNVYPKVDVIVRRFARKPVRGALTKFECALLPTGAYTIGAT